MKQRQHFFQTVVRRVGCGNSQKQLAALRRIPHPLHTNDRSASTNPEANEAEELSLLDGVHFVYSVSFPSVSAVTSGAAALPPSDAISLLASTSASVV
ncbi:MAG TPA: hypothetical protein VK583_00010, partial [Burkholderiales bacterium]|nr:hypothetical protein [Burkholderiales bacterium]